MANVLIIRISAIGDVAMTIPVIYSVARDNPTDSFTVLTQEFLISLFINRPANVKLIGIDTKKAEKSLTGIIGFALYLKKNKYNIVFDLHNVIRSRIIDLVFFLNGVRIFLLYKGRNERKKITGKSPKSIKALPAMTSRYADLFRRAGFRFKMSFQSLYEDKPADRAFIDVIAGEKKGTWIGIAPFAKHRGKIYPINLMEEVVAALCKQPDTFLFLLGGKGFEEAILDEWENNHMCTRNLAGKYTLDQELAVISRLDVLISMDSANMHFASLVNTPVISVWGATHPYAGFYGYRQSPELAIQKDMACRPCSVFGNKPCSRGDWACLDIAPEIIIKKVNEFLPSDENCPQSN